jgi:ketosteroid isomerase-like protein
MSATKAGESDTVLNLLAEDVMFLVTGQPLMTGKSALAAAQAQSSQTPFQFESTSEIQAPDVGRLGAYVGKTVCRSDFPVSVFA